MKHFSDFGLTPLMAVVDIETPDTQITAGILSIGCVVVNVFTGELLNEFYRTCNLANQFDMGRTLDERTLDWWNDRNKVSQGAYDAAWRKDIEPVELEDALTCLNQFLKSSFDNQRVQLMGNGCEFDNVILDHAMQQFGIKPAWDYGANQSLRTIVWMGRMLMGIDPKYTLELQDGEVKHHALHDARHEAKYLCSVFQSFHKQLNDMSA